MRSLFAHSLALVGIGWLAYVLGYVLGGMGFFGGNALLGYVGAALLVVGVAAHLWALANDLRRGRASKPVPFVGVINAVVMAALFVWFALVSRGVSSPSAQGATLENGAAVVTVGSDRYVVPLDACGPPPTTSPELRLHEDTLFVAVGDGSPPFLTWIRTGERIVCPE